MNRLTDFPYQHILVLGLAKSGTAAAKLLLQNQFKVRVNDIRPNEEHVETLKKMGAEVITGSHPLSVLDDIEIIVKNPGIPYDNVVIEEAQKRNIPIITEVELAWKLVDQPIIAITGSNGKTTTTTLIGEMLRKSKQPVQVAGNIGQVAVEIAANLQANEKMVLELSSFQLLGVESFKPNIAIILNIYEAHLDYHKTFANYQEAKWRIFKNQTAEDYLIYNADDPHLQQAIQEAKATLIPFSTKRRLNNGIWANEHSIYDRDKKLIDRSDIVLVGQHNLENILAAIGAAKLAGATHDGIVDVLTSFAGVKHRLEFVANINERLFYNDSKATNILATQKALQSFNQPTILLAGGLDRGNDFDDLIPYLAKVKMMVVFGETAEKLRLLGKQVNIKTIHVEDVKEAVKVAFQHSNQGDVILLSPACASWDQYRTFEERGDMFVHTVHTLK